MSEASGEACGSNVVVDHFPGWFQRNDRGEV